MSNDLKIYSSEKMLQWASLIMSFYVHSLISCESHMHTLSLLIMSCIAHTNINYRKVPVQIINNILSLNPLWAIRIRVSHASCTIFFPFFIFSFLRTSCSLLEKHKNSLTDINTAMVKLSWCLCHWTVAWKIKTRLW